VPEGHTIHRLALDHARILVGDVLRVSSPQGRHPVLAATLDGQRLEDVAAVGKHLFYTWAAAPVLHIHLGLIGRLRESPPGVPATPNIQLRLAGPRATADLIGATTCELLGPEAHAAILDRLGPDVLAPDADPDRAFQRLQRRSIPIAQALLDQQVLSGIGNVYRAEALFVTGIHPLRPANSLTRAEFDRLWDTLRAMLQQGVVDRRIVTVDPDERGADLEGVFYVYKQGRCRRCGGEIRSWQLGPRRAYACEVCQT
jgi:formamidopyrimidine-DNA glycosylase